MGGCGILRNLYLSYVSLHVVKSGKSTVTVRNRADNAIMVVSTCLLEIYSL